MAVHVPIEITEQILVALDVKDLIRYKSVCKSWKSLISELRFVKSHLNHSYKDDVNNNKMEHRRIIMGWLPFGVTPSESEHDSYLLGSSNGLVCMSTSDAKILVANPLTREMKTLQTIHLPFWSLCFGFGYDSSIDDYKVIVGFEKSGNRICFQVLTLKSHVWKDIGEVMYSFITKVGVLYNDALHWFMKDQNNKKVILSFGLSGEEFKEIPQPDDALYQVYAMIKDMRLGIKGGCLCIYHDTLHPRYRLWIMKRYNVKQSWETGYDCEKKCDIFHFLRRVNNDMLNFCHDHIICSYSILSAPIFVKSLVSPLN